MPEQEVYNETGTLGDGSTPVSMDTKNTSTIKLYHVLPVYMRTVSTLRKKDVGRLFAFWKRQHVSPNVNLGSYSRYIEIHCD